MRLLRNRHTVAHSIVLGHPPLYDPSRPSSTMRVAILVLAVACAIMPALAQSASFPRTPSSISLSCMMTYGTLIEACALPCLLLANSGTCQIGDSSCLCQERSYVSSVETCFESRCSNADEQRALRTVSELCDLVTVCGMLRILWLLD
jgi:hypothetical protein